MFLSDGGVIVDLASKKKGVAMTRFGVSKKNRSLVIGILCGIGCALCVWLYVVNVNEQANVAQAEMLAKYGGDQIEVCVAKRDIMAGDTLRDSDIDTKMWIAALLPADAITVRGDAVGKQVGSTILSGEVISAKRFGLEASEIDVPKGFSAISVPAKDVQAVGGAIRPGMRCDVYATGANATSRLASNVLVLATSSNNENDTSTPVTWITLALMPDNVEEMVSAAQNLDLYFVLPSENPAEDHAAENQHTKRTAADNVSDRVQDESNADASTSDQSADEKESDPSTETTSHETA